MHLNNIYVVSLSLVICEPEQDTDKPRWHMRIAKTQINLSRCSLSTLQSYVRNGNTDRDFNLLGRKNLKT